jgi:hypothetical protein
MIAGVTGGTPVEILSPIRPEAIAALALRRPVWCEPLPAFEKEIPPSRHRLPEVAQP